MSRDKLATHKRWVIKVGSALLTDDGAGLDLRFIESLVGQIAELRSLGIEVILVSSGSIAAGVSRLGLSERPTKVDGLQAAAAVGQAALVRAYEDAFARHDTKIAQILLTHADIANRKRYLNARSAMQCLLGLGVQCIINENDTVATDEIRFGDNDSLGALVTNLMEAELLVILTDQNGLYTADPRIDQSAQLVCEGVAGDENLKHMATGSASWGRGGMVTKLAAAEIASRSGASTVIANGRQQDIVRQIHAGEAVGTYLKATHRLQSKKQWLAGQMQTSGTLLLDQGAVDVLKQSGKSLLPVGVKQVSGSFERGSLVACVDEQGQEVARGLSNYGAEDAQKIAGRSSDQITELLGYGGDDELIHRDNLVVF